MVKRHELVKVEKVEILLNFFPSQAQLLDLVIFLRLGALSTEVIKQGCMCLVVRDMNWSKWRKWRYC